MAPKKNTKKRAVLFIIPIIILVIGLIVFYPKIAQLGEKHCEPELNRTQSCSFEVTGQNQGVLFNYCGDFQPGSYPPLGNTPPRRPNYNIEGYGGFMMFGDGTYSWEQRPYHEYTNTGSYKVVTELTQIDKNGGAPPPPTLAALFTDELVVCQANLESTTNQYRLLTDGQHLSQDISRPMHCDYTFVLIVTFGGYDEDTDVNVDIHYDPSRVVPIQMIEYADMPYDMLTSLNNPISLSGCSVDAGEEKSIFIQFKVNCEKGQDCNEILHTPINTSIYETSSNPRIIQENNVEYDIQACGRC